MPTDARELVDRCKALVAEATGPYWTVGRQQAKETLISLVPELVETIERLVEVEGES